MKKVELEQMAIQQGIDPVGKSRKELMSMLGVQSDQTDQEPRQEEQFNTATVLLKGRELRRFTLEVHGKAFIDLANDFATKHGGEVKTFSVNPGKSCPNCGYKL